MTKSDPTNSTWQTCSVFQELELRSYQELTFRKTTSKFTTKERKQCGRNAFNLKMSLFDSSNHVEWPAVQRMQSFYMNLERKRCAEYTERQRVCCRNLVKGDKLSNSDEQHTMCTQLMLCVFFFFFFFFSKERYRDRERANVYLVIRFRISCDRINMIRRIFIVYISSNMCKCGILRLN